MTTNHEGLKEELEFRLSLLRLLTEPHPAAEQKHSTPESRQLEQLVELVPGR